MSEKWPQEVIDEIRRVGLGPEETLGPPQRRIELPAGNYPTHSWEIIDGVKYRITDMKDGSRYRRIDPDLEVVQKLGEWVVQATIGEDTILL